MSGNTNGVRSARDSIAATSKLPTITTLQTTSELLGRIISINKQELKELKQELSLVGDGRLHIRKRQGGFNFCVKLASDMREYGITRDRERILTLARKSYIEARIGIIEIQLKKLDSIIGSFDEAAYERRIARRLNRFSEAGLDIARILFTREQNEWIDQPYNPNPYRQENLIHATTNGMYMRSKSEAAIGSKLEAMGLPYRYDDFITIGSNIRGAKAYAPEEGPYRESYYADFKIPNLLGGITVHEHFGAFHVQSYGESSLKRLNDYHNFGVIEIPGSPVKHDEFTWSFESDVRGAKALDRLIAKMLLPGLL